MREYTITIKPEEILSLFPLSIKEKLQEESLRLEQRLTERISYSEDIRMKCPDGREAAALSGLSDDEEARRLFAYQLQEEALLNGLFSIKVRSGRNSEALFHYLKSHVNRSLLSSSEKYAQAALLAAHREEADNGAHSDRHNRRRTASSDFRSWNVAGQLSDERSLGRTAVFQFLALTIGRRTKLLRSAAARFQLLPVLEMLDLYDSIGLSTPEHIPDLFAEARKIRRHFVIHVGGTNTGKTYDAMKMLAQAPSGVYLCPLRMLAYEGRAVIEKYHVPCSFATGEEKEINPEAKHISETIGMLDYSRHYAAAVIDECQLISGEDGSLYTNAILGVAADTVYVCCAVSGLDITKRLISLCGDTYEVIEHKRSNPLIFENAPYEGPRRYDAYIVFSRIGAYQMASWLEEQGMNPSIVYGKLPYEVKMEEARKFEEGETDCLVATDAIAIGQNYNIERIIFRDITKHINRKEIRLDSQTVKQVAGRAGRYGRFPAGYVNTYHARDREEIRSKLEEADQPSQTAPLELPAFLVQTELPLSLIYKAWTAAECGAPFIKADTSVEEYICRLIEDEFSKISKEQEYSLASLPLDLKDKDQLELLRQLLACYCSDSVSSGRSRTDPDEKWKSLLPSQSLLDSILRYRPHLMTCEKLCRLLDLAASFFYKIRRDDLASWSNCLKAPIPKKIAQIMAESIPEGELRYDRKTETAYEIVEEEFTDPESGMQDTRRVRRPVDISSWPTAYIYLSVSGQTERNTGRFPAGDYSKLYSHHLEQSFGNEAEYIDYFCYRHRERIPDYCRYEPYYRYTVRLDPQFIIEDRGSCFLAERFVIIRSEYRENVSRAASGWYNRSSGRGRRGY